uniref:Uncharacterized protein n=1 Tax=Anguilla anguilla TaxID=7936 RepID=A0A0E9SQZ4_ANGAN
MHHHSTLANSVESLVNYTIFHMRKMTLQQCCFIQFCASFSVVPIILDLIVHTIFILCP